MTHRLLGVGCRTVHLAAFGMLVGGHGFGIEAERLLPALWITVASGAALLAVVTVASIGSHLPRRFRHASLLSIWTAAPGSGGRQPGCPARVTGDRP